MIDRVKAELKQLTFQNKTVTSDIYKLKVLACNQNIEKTLNNKSQYVTELLSYQKVFCSRQYRNGELLQTIVIINIL
jgi:hypothetical protein